MHKSYGDTVAVDDVSFTVQEGEIFGIPGPTAPTSRTSEIDISLAVSPHGPAAATPVCRRRWLASFPWLRGLP